jgi:hypothetical protein
MDFNMKMRKEILLGVFGMIFLVVGMFFVLGQDEIITESFSDGELFDASYLVAPDLEPGYISVENVDIEKLGGVSTISFKKTKYVVPAGTVKIGDNSFDNIASTEDLDSTLKVNEAGEVIEADFHMSGKGDTFIIGGAEVYAPPKSRVIYDGNEVKVIVNDGKTIRADFLEDAEGKVTFEGKSFSIRQPDGSSLPFKYGERVHFDGSNYYVEDGDLIDYGGVSFSPKERVDVYFDGKIHDGPAISLGEDSFSLSAGDNPDIGKVIISGGYKDEDGYYRLGGLVTSQEISDAMELGRLDNMDDRILTVGLTEPNSAINFFGEKNPLNSNIPTVSCYGGYEINTGTLSLASDNGKVLYGRDSDANVFSREIVVADYTNDKYIRHMQIGQKSNMRFGISDVEKGFALRSGEYKPLNNFNLRYFADSPEDFGTYDFGYNQDLKNEFVEKRNYLLGAQSVLNEELAKRASSNPVFAASLIDHGGDIPLYKLDEFTNQFKGVDFFLTVPERDSILEERGYGDYVNVMNSMRDMVPYHITYGEKEGAVDILDQKYGVRQAFLRYFVSEKDFFESEKAKSAVEYANRRNQNPSSRFSVLK